MKIDEEQRFDDGMVWAAAAGVLLLFLFILTVALAATGVILLLREIQ